MGRGGQADRVGQGGWRRVWHIGERGWGCGAGRGLAGGSRRGGHCRRSVCVRAECWGHERVGRGGQADRVGQGGWRRVWHIGERGWGCGAGRGLAGGSRRGGHCRRSVCVRAECWGHERVGRGGQADRVGQGGDRLLWLLGERGGGCGADRGPLGRPWRRDQCRRGGCVRAECGGHECLGPGGQTDGVRQGEWRPIWLLGERGWGHGAGRGLSCGSRRLALGRRGVCVRAECRGHERVGRGGQADRVRHGGVRRVWPLGERGWGCGADWDPFFGSRRLVLCRRGVCVRTESGGHERVGRSGQVDRERQGNGR